MTKMPVLLNGDMTPARKLRASSLSLTEEAAGAGEASLVLAPGERLRVRDPVLLFGPDGPAGIWFVRAATLDAETGATTAELSGGLSSLADDCLPDEDLILSGDFASVVSRLLACQSERPGAGRLWAPGECEIGESVLLEAGGRDLLSCLLALFSEFPEYRMEADQSTLPWRLSFLRADGEPPAEGRLARNLESLRIRRDDSLLRTRVVSEALPGGYLDGEAAETFGVIAEAVPLSEDADGESALAAARRYLANRREPAVSVSVEAADLSLSTGEAKDRFRIGRMLRLRLPDGETVAERIVKRALPDAFGDPERVRLELANPAENLRMSVARLSREAKSARQARGRTGRRSRRNSRKLQEQGELLSDARLEIDRAHAQIRLMATQTDLSDVKERMRRAGITVDGALAEVRLLAEKSELDDLGGRVTTAEASIAVNAEGISLKVGRGEVISAINQTAEAIRISAQRIDLSGYVTASQLSAALTAAENIITDVCTVRDAFYVGSDRASWQSTTVVSSVSFSTGTLANIATADVNGNVVGRASYSYVRSASRKRRDLYYLGQAPGSEY